MDGNDDIVAQLKAIHTAAEIERLRTALAERDATIERLTGELESTRAECASESFEANVFAGHAKMFNEAAESLMMFAKPIKNDEELSEYLKRAEALMDTDPEPDTHEGDQLRVLSLIIEDYELKFLGEDGPTTRAQKAERDLAEAIRNLSSEARAHGLALAQKDAAERERDEARAEVERLKGLLWYSWHEFNAIKARHGAPVDHYLMLTVDPEYWEQLTKAFAAAIGPEDAKPWPSTRARAALQQSEVKP